MSFSLPSYSTLSILAATCFFAGLASASLQACGYDHSLCKERAVDWYSNNHETNRTFVERYFLDEDFARDRSNTTAIRLTLEGCAEFCGPGTIYWDAPNRFVVWSLPVLLLLANFELTPIDKRRFISIIHAIGDPIDSFWNCILKLSQWRRLYGIAESVVRDINDYDGLHIAKDGTIDASDFTPRVLDLGTIDNWHTAICNARNDIIQLEGRFRWCTYSYVGFGLDRLPFKKLGLDEQRDERITRIIAAVLSGFEEISPTKIESNSDSVKKILQTFCPLRTLDQWTMAGARLVENRGMEFLKTCLAITIYIFGVVQALVPEIGGGSTTPPGGRIASAMMLSWLIPLVLLSNTFGAFPSRRTCIDIITEFMVETQAHHANQNAGIPQEVTEWARICKEPRWLEAIYTYRRTHVETGVKITRAKFTVFIAALFPLLVSALGASLILWFAVPSGFSCRHVWVGGLFLAWLLATYHGVPRLLRPLVPVGDKNYWILVLTKDILVGLATIGFPTASNLGAWNNCKCWSTRWAWWDGMAPYVPVGTDAMFEKNRQDIYNWVVLGTMIFQVVFYMLLMMRFWDGIKVIRWTENHMSEVWNRSAVPRWQALGIRIARAPQRRPLAGGLPP